MSDEKPTSEHVQYGDGFATITLSRPLDLDGTKVSTIQMREPNMDDQIIIEKMKGGDAERARGIFANLCELPPSVIGKLPVRDIQRLGAAFAGFTD